MTQLCFTAYRFPTAPPFNHIKPKLTTQSNGYDMTMKQHRPCTYNVTVRRVRATILAVEKQCVLHILSVCL